MKTIPLSLVFLLGVSFGALALAESSKIMKIDLDVDNTLIVRAEIGQGDWFYWADTTACVCWVGGKTASGSNCGASATFDCKRLKAHPKLAEALAKCE